MNEVIRQLRIHKGLTQRELAKMSGLQQSTICRIEKDCSKTSWNKILKLLVALKLDVKKFIDKLYTYNEYDRVKYSVGINLPKTKKKIDIKFYLF
ncbi:XRE family transcriptional regulator [Spiroplasma sp. ChiS]|uniref:helix-turn-helix domain-containing protein n=1 Tax=Spiroplasma sp. ChiS TaxID=2099885 RepID=UPI000CFA306F|nr:helix-turn-helix transcriptional regulator [Spiroplasma sp. ChiS]PQP79473.1 XRE family transcriptional regulator [Spiroplasma sp. ChiS]